MNMDGSSLNVRRYILLPSIAVLLTGCTTHVYNEKVIIEDHTITRIRLQQQYQEQMSEDAGFPDPILRDNMFEARVDSNICIKFASEKKCTW